MRTDNLPRDEEILQLIVVEGKWISGLRVTYFNLPKAYVAPSFFFSKTPSNTSRNLLIPYEPCRYMCA